MSINQEVPLVSYNLDKQMSRGFNKKSNITLLDENEDEYIYQRKRHINDDDILEITKSCEDLAIDG